MRKFAWQDGYAAFSVSESQVGAVRQYIQQQGYSRRRHRGPGNLRPEWHKALRSQRDQYLPAVRRIDRPSQRRERFGQAARQGDRPFVLVVTSCAFERAARRQRLGAGPSQSGICEKDKRAAVHQLQSGPGHNESYNPARLRPSHEVQLAGRINLPSEGTCQSCCSPQKNPCFLEQSVYCLVVRLAVVPCRMVQAALFQRHRRIEFLETR